MNAALVRCQQCGESKLPAHFVGKRKAQVTWCTECRGKYKGTYGERASEPRRRLRLYAPEPNVIWSASSGNKKLGGIGSAIVSGETCPPSCGFYGRGCYAEFGASGHHWRRSQDEGLAWSAFLERVREQPPGSLWRYAVAGDLPGVGEALEMLQKHSAQCWSFGLSKEGHPLHPARLAYSTQLEPFSYGARANRRSR